MGKQLHIVLFPAMAQGHMIPMLEMANLFSSKGVKTTIIATPAFADPISKSRRLRDIGVVITPFPPQRSTLPKNIVSFEQMTTPALVTAFLQAMELLQEPLEAILHQLRPDCLISDMFLPWTALSAAKFRIPRLAFYGTSFFSRCLSETMELHKPYNQVTSDSDPFILHDLPHRLEFVRSQISPFLLEEAGDNDFTRLFKKMEDSWKNTYGEVVNSFNDLESAYADHYKNVIGRKAWGIGPLLLCRNKKSLLRGKESAIDEHECLSWLDSKTPNSVVYVCFGSVASFSRAQLHETAAGLEASGQDFVWVVRREREKEEEDESGWLPQGFEGRVKRRGLIIRGWAPQVMILDHPAVGAFVDGTRLSKGCALACPL